MSCALVCSFFYLGLTSKLHTSCDSPHRAPELLFSPAQYDPFALDTWALGCTLIEMYLPFVYGDDELDSRAVMAGRGQVDQAGVLDGWRLAPLEEEGSEDEGAPRMSEPGRRRTWRRQSLFEGSRGELALAASIFRVMGTPTESTWPVRT